MNYIKTKKKSKVSKITSKISLLLFLASSLFLTGITPTFAGLAPNVWEALHLEEVHLETISYKLGETDFKIQHYTNQNDKGLTYFHPHASEATSLLMSIKTIDECGGSIISFDNSDNRNIKFKLKNVEYQFDPNRIYTRKGVTDTLKNLGPYSKEAENIVFTFGKWVSGLLSADRVIAIHNNLNLNYNVLSYRDQGGNPIEGIRALHINPDLSPANFLYTTNSTLYIAAVEANLNAVLQGKDIFDDGSYSVFAMKQGIDYVNIEAKHHEYAADLALINYVNRFFNIAPIERLTWKPLKEGDLIDLVATSSTYTEARLVKIQELLGQHGFRVRTQFAAQKDDGLGHSNTDAIRLKQLIGALNAPDSKAVWGIRGGEGTSNFLTEMIATQPPKIVKPVIGFSDITGVHMLINSKWNWPSIHGVLAEFNKEIDIISHSTINKDTSIQSVIDLLTDKTTTLKYPLEPLNPKAQKGKTISTRLIGGNLTLVSTSLSAPYKPTHQPRTLILEDVGASPHQLERFLDQIAYSEAFAYYDAIILGTFVQSTAGDSDKTKTAIERVVKDFAQKCIVPVFRFNQFGHGPVNEPMPMNTETLIVREPGKLELFVKNR